MKKENENQTTGLVEVFSFNQSSTPIRVQVINDEPWFVAKDVCDVLELTNHRMAIKSLDEDEVNSTYLTDALNRQRITNVVNESGLYTLIFQSRKPEANVCKVYRFHIGKDTNYFLYCKNYPAVNVLFPQGNRSFFRR